MEQEPTRENDVIELKQAGITDIPVLLEIERSVAGAKTYSAYLTEDEWEEEMQKSKVYLIEKGIKIVGNTSYEIKDADHAYLSGLAIMPEFQGHGIGREVIARLLDELKDIKRIDLVTHPDNERAIKLYESFGFVVESRKENYFGDGEPRLVLALVK